MKFSDITDFPEVPGGVDDTLDSLQNKGVYRTPNKHNERLGEYVEKCVQEYILQYLCERLPEIEIKNIPKNLQGGCDIVINYKKEFFYFIEVKSIWKKSSDCSKVGMTDTQFNQATRHKDCYALFVADMTAVPHSVVEKSCSFLKIEDRISVYTDIGYLENYEEVKGVVNVVLEHLQQKLSVRDFCEYLVSLINSKS